MQGSRPSPGQGYATRKKAEPQPEQAGMDPDCHPTSQRNLVSIPLRTKQPRPASAFGEVHVECAAAGTALRRSWSARAHVRNDIWNKKEPVARACELLVKDGKRGGARLEKVQTHQDPIRDVTLITRTAQPAGARPEARNASPRPERLWQDACSPGEGRAARAAFARVAGILPQAQSLDVCGT
jgi:hypothetical protein